MRAISIETYDINGLIVPSADNGVVVSPLFIETYNASGAPVGAVGSGPGSGTVTSVALTVPSIMSVSGSPITTAGTLAVSLTTETANTVFAGPTSGGAAIPTFRSLVAADIPAHAHNIHTGLTTGDDHTQYFLLAGRSGGQTAYGDTAASGNLMLNSTAHATKGNVLIGGSTLRIDENLTTVGIKGAAVSAQATTIYTGADANIGLQIRQNSATQSANLLEITGSTGITKLIKVGPAGTLAIGSTATPSSNINLLNVLSSTDPGSNVFTNDTQLSLIITADQALQHFAQRAQTIVNVSTTKTLNNTTFTTLSNFVISASNAGTISTASVHTFFFNVQAGAAGAINTSNLLTTLAIFANPNTITIPVLRHLNIVALTAANGATINNLFGIEIGDQTAGATNYAIRTNAGNIVFNEGANNATVFRVETGADPAIICTVPGTNRIGFGTASANTKVHGLLTDAGTNAVVNVLTIGHDSSGTPAAGFGTGIIVEGESSTTASQIMGRLTYEWVVATHASRTARGKLTVYDTAEREAIRIEASGTAPMIGFFGHTAAVQPAAYTPTNVTTDRSYDANSTTVDELADVIGTIIADLQSVGLLG